jgi:ribose transport system substrate-binding protein
MSLSRLTGLLALLVCAFVVGACGSTDDPEAGGGNGPAGGSEPPSSTGEQSRFFNQAAFDEQMEWADMEPQGPDEEPWAQHIDAEMVGTSEYASDEAGGWNLCFSNAATDNPWRQVGWRTMQAEVDLHDDEIAGFRTLDAEASDNRQVSDIQSFINSGTCDALIVSPNTTATLTPVVEQACEADIPVIVFDRGVNTDCPVTFIHPIGGYKFGADAANFLVDQVPEGGKVLALRILPGVDVLETRWAGAKEIFDEAGLNVVGVEFTEGDRAKTKSTVADYLQREGQIDGVWMDAGATSVAAIEAFEDAGMEVPPITGEDQQDFLTKWQEDDLTAIAPTYPTYQWRTPIIAALKILRGEEVPSEWVLPQPAITQETLDDYSNPDMPPLHYALCGCEDLPGYPERWGG